jgi:hypothetical protein
MPSSGVKPNWRTLPAVNHRLGVMSDASYRRETLPSTVIQH